MFEKRKPSFEKLSQRFHPEHQTVNTSVAEYFRKYGQGKIDSMPTDGRPEVNDDRSEDEMLDLDSYEPGLGTDELDVIQRLSDMRERFEKAVLAIEASEKDKEAFEGAVQILNDSNSSPEACIEATEVLAELEKSGKIKRTRARKS